MNCFHLFRFTVVNVLVATIPFAEANPMVLLYVGGPVLLAAVATEGWKIWYEGRPEREEERLRACHASWSRWKRMDNRSRMVQIDDQNREARAKAW